MGRGKREKPARLSKKLLQIRQDLGISQNDLISHLGMKDKLIREDVSKFERDIKEPTLIILLAYARLAGVSTDVLIDDKADLPK